MNHKICIYLIITSVLIISCQSNLDNEVIGNIHTHIDICEPPRSIYEYDIVNKLNIEKHKLYFDELERLNFDFVVITDHNKIDDNIRKICLSEDRFLCMLGEEVSSLNGHIVAFDINEQINPKLTS
jgi:uncharacterized DUF497 family protein